MTFLFEKDVLIKVVDEYLKAECAKHDDWHLHYNNTPDDPIWSCGFGLPYSVYFMGINIIKENDQIIGYDIWNTYSREKEYVNIKIRDKFMSFAPYSKFNGFNKDFIRGLFIELNRIHGIENENNALDISPEDLVTQPSKYGIFDPISKTFDTTAQLIFQACSEAAETIFTGEDEKPVLSPITDEYLFAYTYTKDCGTDIELACSKINNKTYELWHRPALGIKGVIAIVEVSDSGDVSLYPYWWSFVQIKFNKEAISKLDSLCVKHNKRIKEEYKVKEKDKKTPFESVCSLDVLKKTLKKLDAIVIETKDSSDPTLLSRIVGSFNSVARLVYIAFKDAIKDIDTEYNVSSKYVPRFMEQTDEYMFALENTDGNICAACSEVSDQYELWYRDPKGIKHVFMRLNMSTAGYISAYDGDPHALTLVSARIKKFINDAVKEHNNILRDFCKTIKSVAENIKFDYNDKEEYKMISRIELYDIMLDYLRPRLDEYKNKGGAWAYGSDAGLFYWYLVDDSSSSDANIGFCIIKENDTVIGFDIYNSHSSQEEYVNIKIRKDKIEFIEDSKFEDFDKDFMKGLFNAINSSAEVKKDHTCTCECTPIQDQIKDVIFSDPATTVIWKDGTKTTVKRQVTRYQPTITSTGCKDVPVEMVPFDPEAALAAAIMNKLFGSHSSYSRFVNGYVVKSEEKKKEEDGA